jgi:hypothetical protein
VVGVAEQVLGTLSIMRVAAAATAAATAEASEEKRSE